MSSSYPQGSADLGVPLPREVVEPIVAPHLPRLASAITRAWADFTETRNAASSHLTRVRAAAQGMVVSDLLAEPVRREFARVKGAEVVERFDRPWVHLDGGLVQIRFRALTPTLQICPSQSPRAIRLAFQLPDPTLEIDVPDTGTVLTAGYVLDLSRTRIAQMALVCHVGFQQVHYFFSLPGSETAASPTQMPMVPLSDPIIRSARAAATKRLHTRGDSA